MGAGERNGAIVVMKDEREAHGNAGERFPKPLAWKMRMA